MKLFNCVRTYGAKVVAASASVMLANVAMAQAADPVSTLFAGINLGTVVAAVLALGLVIVGIAMAFKGIDLSKRAIKKV